MSGIWSRKFYHPNDLEKRSRNYQCVREQNGSRLKRFRKPERSDVDEAMLSWYKQQITDSVAVSGLLLMLVLLLFKF